MVNGFTFSWAGKGRGCEAITSLVTCIHPIPGVRFPEWALLSGLSSGKKIFLTFSLPSKGQGQNCMWKSDIKCKCSWGGRGEILEANGLVRYHAPQGLFKSLLAPHRKEPFLVVPAPTPRILAPGFYAGLMYTPSVHTLAIPGGHFLGPVILLQASCCKFVPPLLLNIPRASFLS